MTVDRNQEEGEGALSFRSMATATMTSSYPSSQTPKSESYSEDLSSKVRSLQLQEAGQRKKGKAPVREDSAPLIICEHVPEGLQHEMSVSTDDDFPIEEVNVDRIGTDQSNEFENGSISKSPSTSSLTVPSVEIDEKRPPLLRAEAQDEDMYSETSAT